MYLKNKKIPLGITCYITGKRLSNFLQKNKGLSLFMQNNEKYYFVKNDKSKSVFEGEIPLFYKWLSEILEEKGGEEN